MITIEQIESAVIEEFDYSCSRSGGRLLLLSKRSDRYSYRKDIYINVDVNNKYVEIRGYGCYLGNLTLNMLSLLNKMNSYYGFFKFYADEDKTLIVSTTINIEENRTVYGVLELIARLDFVLDDCYPSVQKAIFG